MRCLSSYVQRIAKSSCASRLSCFPMDALDDVCRSVQHWSLVVCQKHPLNASRIAGNTRQKVSCIMCALHPCRNTSNERRSNCNVGAQLPWYSIRTVPLCTNLAWVQLLRTNAHCPRAVLYPANSRLVTRPSIERFCSKHLSTASLQRRQKSSSYETELQPLPSPTRPQHSLP